MSVLIRHLLTQNTKLARATTKTLSSKLSHFTSAGSSANRKERTRFYKDVNVSESSESLTGGKSYEISLDKRKLRTPGGQLLQVGNEVLANMVAFEWHSQQATIKQHSMHLTSLLNTCLDNPTKATKEQLVANINEYLQTDTLLYFDSNSVQKLDELQERKWRPVVDWFNRKFPDLNLKISYDISSGESGSFVNTTFEHYLTRSFDLSTLLAFNYIVECLKSVILTVALLERGVQSVEEACRLAFLEQTHQYDQWGKVEWYHDINENETLARVSAALVFIYLSNGSKYLITKTNRSL